jgi:hypothetical protein
LIMMNLIAAAVLAAQPVAPAPAPPQGQHEMQMGGEADHKGMDCCKDCCNDKAAMHEGHGSEHGKPSAH